jgi:hypothetical protein
VSSHNNELNATRCSISSSAGLAAGHESTVLVQIPADGKQLAVFV